MSNNLSLTPKTVAIVEKITIVRAYEESINYGEKYNAKNRKVSRTKNLNLPPTTAIDTHVMTEKRDSIHRFPQNIEFNRR